LSGLSFLPIPIIIGLVSTRAPQLVDRFGFKPLMVFGITLVAVGTFTLSFLTAESSYWTHLLPAFIAMGIGFGVAFVAITIAATSGVPDEESGLAAGLINTSQQIGGALGIAVLAVVASSSIRADLAKGVDPVLANVDGYQQAFVWATAMIVAALFVAIYVIQAPAEAADPENEKRAADPASIANQ
jgi:MFS family permease